MNAITNFTPFSLTVGTSVYTLAKIHQIIRPSLMIMNLCATVPAIAFHDTSIGINVWGISPLSYYICSTNTCTLMKCCIVAGCALKEKSPGKNITK